MVSKLIVFSVIVFSQIDILLSEKLITQKQLCGQYYNESDFDQFYVTTAFKIGQYITIVGRVWKKSQMNESEAIDAAIRVLHWTQRDPSGHTSYEFFDAKVWTEILRIQNRKPIRYSFSTNNMFPIFPDQKLAELVYMVEDTNKTTAYQFNYTRIESMEEPTYHPNSDQNLVYDPVDDYDESEYLSIKFLFLQIPHNLKIISIMIYDRTPHNSQHPIHYAIVYTEELFEGKPYYFRHYLKSKRHRYKDYRGEDYTFYRLDWFFDDTIDYCDQLAAPPTAVVLLRKEMFNFIWYLWYHNIDDIYFVEFYGLTHNILKLRFESRFQYTTTLTIKEMDNKQQIDNAEALLNCKQHPIFTLPKPIDCRDYPNEIKDQIDGDTMFEYQSRNSKDLATVWTFIIATVMVLAIVAMMVFSLYTVLTIDGKVIQNNDEFD